jgi:hypothetical protein
VDMAEKTSQGCRILRLLAEVVEPYLRELWRVILAVPHLIQMGRFVPATMPSNVDMAASLVSVQLHVQSRPSWHAVSMWMSQRGEC